jgi:cation diffusion facilitator family transporter
MDKVQVAWVSLLVTFVLLLGKLIIGLTTGSLVILSLAAESGVDMASVLITLLAVRISSVPPDEDHPYGHGKFESLSALAEALMLLGVTVWIAIHAVQHLTGTPRAVEVNFWSFAILIVSVGLDWWRARTLKNAAKQHHSNALEASSLHFLSDSLSAFVAIAALLAIRFLGWSAADDIGALMLAGLVAYLSIQMIVRAANGLTDRITSLESTEQIRRIIQRNPGVEELSRLRIRQAGAVLFVEASVTIDRVLPFAAIQRIISDLEKSICEEFSNADVTIHWRPVRSKSEAPFETVKIVAGEFGLLPHNIEISETAAGEMALDYHLEFATCTSLKDAEALSRRVESRLREEMPNVGPIFVHLEEERSDLQRPKIKESTDQAEFETQVSESVMSLSSAVRRVRDVHLFREESQDLQKLVLTVELAGDPSLHESHEIATQIEIALRRKFPEITRIVIHASASAQ